MFAEVETGFVYAARFFEKNCGLAVKGIFLIVSYSLLMNGFLITSIVPVGQRSMVLENSIKPSFIVLHSASNIASDPERD